VTAPALRLVQPGEGRHYVTPYRPVHFERIFRGADSAALECDRIVAVSDLASEYSTGPAFTALDRTTHAPVAAGGLLPGWRGWARGWAVVSPRVRNWAAYDRVRFHRDVRRRLDSLIAELRLQRVEVNLRQEVVDAQRWVEALGFRAESVMPLYRDGVTWIRYVRLQERP
jgi:hypothetical protein